MAKEFIIRKEHDEIIPAGLKAFHDHLKAMPVGKYKITITKSDKRTLSQNDWFHSVLPLIKEGLRDAGYEEIRTNEDAKDFVKSLFFKKDVTNGVETVQVIQGTSETSKLDFASKAEDIIIWAQTYLNIDVAPPGKQFEFFE